MSNNQISGKIPSWFLNFTSLDTLVMRDNLLDGQFPIGFSSIQFLDLSGNQFSCSIPSSPELNYMHLQRNRFTGSLPSLLLNSSSLMSLDLGYNNSGGIPSWIGELSELRVLLLKENNFSGPIPEQLCQLNRTLFMDLSLNNFVGSIPQCLNNISFGRIDDMEYPFYPRYSGDWCVKIIFLVSVLDLSCNHLTGKIPSEIGDLHKIIALNLSHNFLTRSIPKSFSKLRHLESLDLSCNNLSGEIPPQLIELHSLAVFSVAYNNLSGRSLPDGVKGKGYEEVDLTAFSASFAASYITCLLALASLLYINPYWRRMWFHLINEGEFLFKLSQTLQVFCFMMKYFILLVSHLHENL
ncbi:PREDICTED: leucine-rich repeat receptor-like protein kinase PEPR1 [Nelumbo nucifera]|uniref:Leucine-rich repeat receptor-like protein kinase PEPR1 n=1 Tax=Nelumbo nucifera TaxID=4432 RepID=A0A1U8Q116_NELNU|nr:PREDICTED: leucine-rich repeat receptor-like protein kinase PEPR1 [Nelumbo nucifera]